MTSHGRTFTALYAVVILYAGVTFLFGGVISMVTLLTFGMLSIVFLALPLAVPAVCAVLAGVLGPSLRYAFVVGYPLVVLAALVFPVAGSSKALGVPVPWLSAGVELREIWKEAAALVLVHTAIFAAAAAIGAMRRRRKDARATPAVPSMAPWPAMPGLALFILPALGAALVAALAAKELFEPEENVLAGQCEGVGVQLLAKPVAPVKSIAYDWSDPGLGGCSAIHRSIEVDGRGRVLGYGTHESFRAHEGRKLSLDFTESRKDYGNCAGRALRNPDAPYYRFPTAGEPYYGVDEISADAIAFLDVDKPQELRKAVRERLPLRFTVTLTDRRSGAVLGRQVYVLDEVNQRACGVNLGSSFISTPAFIHDAVNR